jgi:hypothetical protein
MKVSGKIHAPAALLPEKKLPTYIPSFRTGRLERELQMVQLSAIRCSCTAILWVSLASPTAITLCVSSQRVIIVVVYFVIDSVRKLLDTPPYEGIVGLKVCLQAVAAGNRKPAVHPVASHFTNWAILLNHLNNVRWRVQLRRWSLCHCLHTVTSPCDVFILYFKQEGDSRREGGAPQMTTEHSLD